MCATPPAFPRWARWWKFWAQPLIPSEVFTDENGFYSAAGLLPGVYNIKAYSPSFLPALRERVGLRPGSSVLVDLKLSGLFDAIQIPAMRGASASEDDDWKWVLRSASNRPILRMLDARNGVASRGCGIRTIPTILKGTLSFVAGSASEGFGSASDMSTVFSVERSIFSTGTMAFQGNVGYGNGSPNAVLRASYSHSMANGSKPEMAFTMRRLAAPGIDSRTSALQALALTASDEFYSRRHSGASFRQRITDHPVHGTGDGIPSVWLG